MSVNLTLNGVKLKKYLALKSQTNLVNILKTFECLSSEIHAF